MLHSKIYIHVLFKEFDSIVFIDSFFLRDERYMS